MNSKLSIALLSGLSLFLSVGAYAVADEKSGDYLNWSYAMGETPQNVKLENVQNPQPVIADPESDPTCTEGCPGRPDTDKDVVALTLSYENEVVPIADQMEIDTALEEDKKTYVSVKSKNQAVAYSEPMSNQKEMLKAETSSEETLNVQRDEPRLEEEKAETSVETRYVTTPVKVEYPVTRQYPVSVQYPVTVQRNMTVEQPVIMQQPVIVRRPVVMQQDITVQRQPTVIHHQPVVMNQQPTYVQQQPMIIQAPAQPIPQMMMPQIMGSVMPMGMTQQVPYMPQAIIAPQPVQPVYQMSPQQYQIQGQVQAQPVYNMAPDISHGQGFSNQSLQLVQQPTFTNSAQ